MNRQMYMYLCILGVFFVVPVTCMKVKQQHKTPVVSTGTETETKRFSSTFHKPGFLKTAQTKVSGWTNTARSGISRAGSTISTQAGRLKERIGKTYDSAKESIQKRLSGNKSPSWTAAPSFSKKRIQNAEEEEEYDSK